MEWIDAALLAALQAAGPAAVGHAISVSAPWRAVLDSVESWETLAKGLGPLVGESPRLARDCYVSAATSRVHCVGVLMDGEARGFSPWQDLRAPSGVLKVACGRFHTLYLTCAGEVYAAGDGTHGCLGLGDFDSVERPEVICAGHVVETALSEVKAQPRSLREAMALGRSGAAQAAASRVVQLVNLRGAVTSVAAGASHTALLTRDGNVFTCGANCQGQLGVPSRGQAQATSLRVDLPWAVAEIECGEGHTIVLAGAKSTAANTACVQPQLRCWGQNKQGQVGVGVNPDDTLLRNQPKPVSPCLPDSSTWGGHVIVMAVCAGGLHTLALTADARALAWGSNAYGQCGRRYAAHVASANSDVFTPTEVEGLCGRVVRLFAGCFHSMALLEDGALYAWGCNKKGQLGVVTELACNPQPVRVLVPGMGKQIAAASGGIEHSAVLLADGTTVLTCGSPIDGRLGREEGVDPAGAPLICSELAPMEPAMHETGWVASSIVAGWRHTVMISSRRACRG